MVAIYTLGDFDIRANGESILDIRGYSYKGIKLFKYFLTFYGKRLLPEKIIEDFRMDEEFTKPKDVLRTQISRVRNIADIGEEDSDPFFKIRSVSGYYIMSLDHNCKVDFIDFERCILEGEALMKDNPEQGMEKLGQGLSLYKGRYLPETEEDWLVPIESRYERLYLKGLSSYFKVLDQKRMYHEIIEMSEKALQINPYEEIINLYFIEALTKTGQKRYANTHYQQYTAKLYNDLNIKPSQGLRDLYKWLQGYEGETMDIINLGILNEELNTEVSNEGVLVCDTANFKLLHNFETRNKGRVQKDIFIGLITIDSKKNEALYEEDIRRGMEVLFEVVYKNVRKGDVLTKWNHEQVALMLYGIEEKSLGIVSKRLEDKFHKNIVDDRITINIKYTPL